MPTDRLAYFRAAASALYGEDRWQRPVARALHVDERTVRRWVAGDSPLPANIEKRIHAVVLAKMQALREIIETEVARSGR